jgi:simple sugar transport system ATP-binding protein
MAITSRSEGGVIMAMNPTRGLDIGATGFVHRQMSSLCDAGHAVVLVSEDLDELMKLCDRIVVLRGGSLVAEFDRAGFGRHEIGAQMVGASDA